MTATRAARRSPPGSEAAPAPRVGHRGVPRRGRPRRGEGATVAAATTQSPATPTANRSADGRLPLQPRLRQLPAGVVALRTLHSLARGGDGRRALYRRGRTRRDAARARLRLNYVGASRRGGDRRSRTPHRRPSQRPRRLRLRLRLYLRHPRTGKALCAAEALNRLAERRRRVRRTSSNQRGRPRGARSPLSTNGTHTERTVFAALRDLRPHRSDAVDGGRSIFVSLRKSYAGTADPRSMR